MAKNTRAEGPSVFPDGPIVRETDDPNIVAVPRPVDEQRGRVNTKTARERADERALIAAGEQSPDTQAGATDEDDGDGAKPSKVAKSTVSGKSDK